MPTDTLRFPVLPGFNQVCQSRYGVMLYNRNDKYVGRSIERYGEFCQGEVDVFSQIVKPGDIVVDAGANIGGFTLPLARMVGSEGGVIAFEPQFLVYQALCANVALNSLMNVVCHNVALGAAPGSMLIPVLDPHLEDNFGGFAVNGHGSGIPTAVTTLDSLDISRCSMIKVDVEGMEIDVIRGASNLIRKFRPVLFVENLITFGESHGSELVALIRELGYRLYWHRSHLFNPNNYAGESENIFGNAASHNMLCLPIEAETHIEGMPEVE